MKSEFESSPGFALGIDSVSSKYSGIRRVVGDGNCFYRGALKSVRRGEYLSSNVVAISLGQVLAVFICGNTVR